MGVNGAGSHSYGKEAEKLPLHSDQGVQYISRAYVQLTKAYGITPSMSRKGNPHGKAMTEAFPMLKAKCHDRHRSASFHHANDLIGSFVLICNDKRNRQKAGMPPLLLWHTG